MAELCPAAHNSVKISENCSKRSTVVVFGLNSTQVYVGVLCECLNAAICSKTKNPMNPSENTWKCLITVLTVHDS